MELIFKEEVFRIIGAAIEVHRELGHGFLEGVYQEAFELELKSRKIAFEAQMTLPIFYKSKRLKKTYKADFLVDNNIIVEIKAIERLTDADQAQLLNYMNAGRKQLGVLVNFGSKSKLEWKRMVQTHTL